MSENEERGRFLDPDEINDVSPEQKEYMLSKGFRPYRTHHGRVKWIAPQAHGYRSLHTNARSRGRHLLHSFGRLMINPLWQLVVALLGILLLSGLVYILLQ